MRILILITLIVTMQSLNATEEIPKLPKKITEKIVVAKYQKLIDFFKRYNRSVSLKIETYDVNDRTETSKKIDARSITGEVLDKVTSILLASDSLNYMTTELYNELTELENLEHLAMFATFFNKKHKLNINFAEAGPLYYVRRLSLYDVRISEKGMEKLIKEQRSLESLSLHDVAITRGMLYQAKEKGIKVFEMKSKK